MTPEHPSPRSITLVNASAGSGKTYRLTEEVVRCVRPDAAAPVALEGLVAVTYTRKAAGEIGSRIRGALVGAGQTAHAQRLPLAYIGTVHAVCLRLLQEQAIDAGLSPEVDVVPGNEQRLLRQALERALSPDLRQRIEELAYRLHLRWNPRTKQTDWIAPVSEIMTLARSNRIPADALPAMAERSATRLLELLGQPVNDGVALDRAMLEALERAAQALSHLDEHTGVGKRARELVERTLRKARSGGLSWRAWIKLGKINDSGARAEPLAEVKAVAARVPAHPRLHEELAETTRALYEAAAVGLSAYQEWKASLRVVDYVDMLDRANTLVADPDVAQELRQRLELVVVDELQDTSPVQLALFLGLHRHAGRSMWVGDPKQCIFEFAGADPVLMQSVTDWVAKNGGTIERLVKSYRSRPELVDFCSQLFAGAFATQGLGPEDVVVTANRETPDRLSNLPALGLWTLEAGNVTEDAQAVAEGVRRLLESKDETPIVDRTNGRVRAIRPGDIAILVATNAETERLATELAHRGIRASIARAGLLSTPEGAFVDAALRRILDPRDTLAEAELTALLEFDGQSPDEWLAARIRGDAQTTHAANRHRALDLLRELADTLTPSEVLDRVMATLDVTAVAARWPDPHQRTANIEALRRLAKEYEDRCHHEHEPATLAGLLRYFDEAREPTLVRNEELASDHQHVSEGAHAVTLLTYHRAKGLEWPVVVLGSLDRTERRTAFDVSPETDRVALDPDDPLGGRWIRYWPWPFGGLSHSALENRAAASPEGRQIAERERRERIRLLYVGFTRARDHLILVARQAKDQHATHWLDELADDSHQPLLVLPPPVSAHGDATIGVRSRAGSTTAHCARHWTLRPPDDPPARLSDGDMHVVFDRTSTAGPDRPAFRITPSRAREQWPALPELQPIAEERYGARIPLGDATGVSWDTVGAAVHAFLAADRPGLSDAVRLSRATRLLDAANLRRLLAPDALVKASDDLRRFIDARWPAAAWHREIPITSVIATPAGTRRIAGVIDLLLETTAGMVVLDYKSFPGGAIAWTDKARELAPQLAAYARALELAGKPVTETWLVFPVAAGAVRVASTRA